MEQIGKFIWRIDNFSSITAKSLYSNTFSAGSINWQILVFPKGGKPGYFSIYLELDLATLPAEWSGYAQSRLGVINQNDPKASFSKVVVREFSAKQPGYGYPSFIPLSDFEDPIKGYLVNDTCLVEAEVCTDMSIDLWSLVEANSEDQGRSVKKLRTMNNSEEILSLAQHETIDQTLPTATAEPEDPTKEEMDTFFTNLEWDLSSRYILSSQEAAREALAKIEEALNMSPDDFYETGKIFLLRKAFKVLSSFDCSSTFTAKQKVELLVMEEKFKDLHEQVARLVHDKNQLSEKESIKLKLTGELEHSLNKYKDAKAELEQIEQQLAALHKHAEQNKEKILAERNGIFKISKDLTMELEALGKQLPEYEARAKVAEEEEKKVAAEWSKMKDFISSLKRII